MQRIPQTHQTNKKTLIATIVIMVLIVASASAAYAFDLWPFKAEDNKTTTSSSEEVSSGTSQKDLEKQKDSVYSGKNTEEIPVNNGLKATILSLRQENGYVHLSANINTTDASGRCSVVFTKDNARPVTRAIEATLRDNSTLCNVSEIPEQDFSSLGVWHVTFRYIINENSQVVAESDITIK